MNSNYASLAAEASAFGERNDCSVKAIAVVTGRPYAKCHAALVRAGRRNRCGATRAQQANALKELGFQFTSADAQSRTAASIEAELKQRWPNQPVMVFMTHHVAGWDGTRVIDWTQSHSSVYRSRNARKHIKHLWVVTPVGQSAEPPKPIPAKSVAKGVARSWKSQKVRSARSARHHVIDPNGQVHKSLPSAVKALGIDVTPSTVQWLRKQLVKNGEVWVDHIRFRIAH